MTMNIAQAQTNPNPQIDLNGTPANGSPWGGFQLSQCDGPDLSGLKDSIVITFKGQKIQTAVGQNPDGYRPCNFAGLMYQAQYLVNVMLVLGVLAALIGFAYAGFLYIGSPIADKKKKATEMLPKIFWGFVIMLVGWFIVHQILVWLTGNAAYLPG
jgi:hypothetical protein